MKLNVDLEQCQDHLQCVFAAPRVFKEAEDTGRLALRAQAVGQRVVEVEYSAQDGEAVLDAELMCPVQAIKVLG